jgi:acetoin utilization deacetylase AcuC-like enzyme
MREAAVFKVFYDLRQTVEANQSFSPSAEKPAAVVASWRVLADRLGLELDFRPFEPATREQLYKVHDPRYVDGVLDLQRKNGFGNKKPEVAAALPWVCGSAVAATLSAWRDGRPTFSPTSGAHHASWQGGGGYCTFNSLALAALEAHEAGAARVGILDLDCHFGDGTEDIMLRFRWDFVRHYSFGAEVGSRGQSADWLARLPTEVAQFSDCAVVLFNAGVDPHVDDPLGGILTGPEMAERDRIVYRGLRQLGVPVVTMLAGGYQRDAGGGIRPVLDLHDQTLEACFAEYHAHGSRYQ